VGETLSVPSEGILHMESVLATPSFTTEFMAEGISIHDPNTQEVKPTSVTFERLFISEWSCRVVGVYV